MIPGPHDLTPDHFRSNHPTLQTGLLGDWTERFFDDDDENDRFREILVPLCEGVSGLSCYADDSWEEIQQELSIAESCQIWHAALEAFVAGASEI